MTVSLAIAINVLAMFALMGILAYVMSRPARLKPHFAVNTTPTATPAQPRPRSAARASRPARAAVASARP
jgi:hypothetical protein